MGNKKLGLENKNYFFIFVFLVLSLLFFYRIVFLKNTFFIADLMTEHYPWKIFASDVVRTGKIPLWNPYNYSGMPFMANMQSGIFYPLNAFFYVFDFVIAYKIYVVLHFVLAGFFMFLLMREYRVQIYASFFSAIIYAFNGFAAVRAEILSELGVYALFPLVFLFLKKSFEKFKFANFFALFLALQFFSGHPQRVFYEIFAFSIYALFGVFEKKSLKPFLIFIYGVFLSFLISAIQIIPSIELFLNSHRVSGVPFSIRMLNSFALKDFLRFINPFQSYSSNDWAYACYVGIFAFLFCFYSLKSRFKEKKFFYAIFFISIFLITGKNNPFFRIFKNFPLINAFRFPATMNILTVFAISILAGLGLEKLKAKSGIKLLVLCLTFMELFSVTGKFNSTINDDIFRVYGKKTKLLLNDRGLHRVFLTYDAENTRRSHGRNWFEYWINWKDNLYGNLNLVYKIFGVAGEEPLRVKWYSEFLRSCFLYPDIEERINLLSMLGVKYIFSRKEIKTPDLCLISNGEVKVYRNKKFLPRVFIPESAEFMKEQDILKYIKSNKFHPLKEVILIDTDKPGKKNYENIKGRAEIVLYENEKILISADLKKEGFLVLSDTFYPGWKVFIDGNRSKIYRANYVLRAIHLKKGKHRILFLYSPATFHVGKYLSVFGLFSLIFLTKLFEL